MSTETDENPLHVALSRKGRGKNIPLEDNHECFTLLDDSYWTTFESLLVTAALASPMKDTVTLRPVVQNQRSHSLITP